LKVLSGKSAGYNTEEKDENDLHDDECGIRKRHEDSSTLH
jgi:hypothetical protein